MECLFCKIVAGEIPANLIYEDSQVIAFSDINPQAPTHLLIVPRSHFENAAELATEDAASLAKLFEVASELASDAGLTGYRTVFNTGADAGQSVFHAHLHLLGGRAFGWPPG
jgi:histidine triad (HIT) family protein